MINDITKTLYVSSGRLTEESRTLQVARSFKGLCGSVLTLASKILRKTSCGILFIPSPALLGVAVSDIAAVGAELAGHSVPSFCSLARSQRHKLVQDRTFPVTAVELCRGETGLRVARSSVKSEGVRSE